MHWWGKWSNISLKRDIHKGTYITKIYQGRGQSIFFAHPHLFLNGIALSPCTFIHKAYETAVLPRHVHQCTIYDSVIYGEKIKSTDIKGKIVNFRFRYCHILAHSGNSLQQHPVLMTAATWHLLKEWENIINMLNALQQLNGIPMTYLGVNMLQYSL